MDVLVCPNCGGRLGVVATIDDPRVVRRILTHLDLLGDGGAATKTIDVAGGRRYVSAREPAVHTGYLRPLPCRKALPKALWVGYPAPRPGWARSIWEMSDQALIGRLEPSG